MLHLPEHPEGTDIRGLIRLQDLIQHPDILKDTSRHSMYSLVGAPYYDQKRLLNTDDLAPARIAYGSFSGNEIAFSAAVNNSKVVVADTDIAASELYEITLNEPDGLPDGLNIQTSGYYKIDWYASVETNTALKHIVAGVAYWIDGGPPTTYAVWGRNHIEPSQANRQYALSGSTIMALAGPMHVGVYVGSEDNITITVDHVGLSIVLLREEFGE